MKAVYFDGSNLLYKKFKEPYAAVEEVKIRFEFGGICSTDLEILKGYGGFVGVLGHEVVGTIVSAPGVPELLNKRVVCDINIGCNRKDCPYCSKELSKHCLKRRAIGINEYSGAFSEYFVVPVFNVIEVPENLSPKKAVFAEPLAAALEPIDRGIIKEKDEIAVFGVGKLGTLAMLALHAKNYNAIGVVRSEKRLQYMKDKFPQLKIKLLDEVIGRFDVIYEAMGNSDQFGKLLNYVKPRGTVILKSTLAEVKSDNERKDKQLIYAFSAFDINNIVVNEVSLRGSRCGNIKNAIDLLASDSIDPTPLIKAEFPLEDAGIAFKKAANNPGEKILLYQSNIDEIA